MITGKPRFNAIVLSSVTIRFSGPTISEPSSLEVDARFVNSALSQHGTTKMQGIYSARTKQALKELAASLEADLARIHFEDDSLSRPDTVQVPKQEKGLGETFGESDVPEG